MGSKPGKELRLRDKVAIIRKVGTTAHNSEGRTVIGHDRTNACLRKLELHSLHVNVTEKSKSMYALQDPFNMLQMASGVTRAGAFKNT